MSEKEPAEAMPEVELVRGTGGYYSLGRFFLSGNADVAYLYNPEGEEPYEVSESGSWVLSLSEAQAVRLRDELTARLEGK